MARDHERRVRWLESDSNELERMVPQSDNQAILTRAEGNSSTPDHTRRVTVTSSRPRNSSFVVEPNNSTIHQRRMNRNRSRSENIPSSRVEGNMLEAAASTQLPPSPEQQIPPPPPPVTRGSRTPTLRSMLHHTDSNLQIPYLNGTPPTPTINGTTTTSSPLINGHVHIPAPSPHQTQPEERPRTQPFFYIDPAGLESMQALVLALHAVEPELSVGRIYEVVRRYAMNTGLAFEDAQGRVALMEEDERRRGGGDEASSGVDGGVLEEQRDEARSNDQASGFYIDGGVVTNGDMGNGHRSPTLLSVEASIPNDASLANLSSDTLVNSANNSSPRLDVYRTSAFETPSASLRRRSALSDIRRSINGAADAAEESEETMDAEIAEVEDAWWGIRRTEGDDLQVDEDLRRHSTERERGDANRGGGSRGDDSNTESELEGGDRAMRRARDGSVFRE